MIEKLFGPEDPELKSALASLKNSGIAVAPVVWIPAELMSPSTPTACLLTVRWEVAPGVERVGVELGWYCPSAGFSTLSGVSEGWDPIAWAYPPPPFLKEDE